MSSGDGPNYVVDTNNTTWRLVRYEDYLVFEQPNGNRTTLYEMAYVRSLDGEHEGYLHHSHIVAYLDET